MNNWLWVFVGGGAGSLARFAISKLLGAPHGFPWATLVANAVASLILGAALYLLLVQFPHKHQLRLLIAVGFCGGFSTFSTFSYETFSLLTAQQYSLALANVLLSVIFCLLAVAFGWWATQWALQA